MGLPLLLLCSSICTIRVLGQDSQFGGLFGRRNGNSNSFFGNPDRNSLFINNAAGGEGGGDVFGTPIASRGIVTTVDAGTGDGAVIGVAGTTDIQRGTDAGTDGGGATATEQANDWTGIRHEQIDSRKREDSSPEAQSFCISECTAETQVGSECHLPYEFDCSLYYRCYQVDSGWTRVTEVCAFGTVYSKAKKICDHPEYAECEYEKCGHSTGQGSIITSYSFNENKICNRAYWQCNNNNISEPKCCKPKEKYSNNGCVPDASCNEPCPLIPNERCRIEAKVGFRFIYNYTECREYFECNSTDTAVRKCCPFQHRYSEDDEKCIPDNEDKSCEEDCSAAIEDCKQEAVVSAQELAELSGETGNINHYYKTKDHNGYKIMKCGPGTSFIKPSTGCPYCGMSTTDVVISQGCEYAVQIHFDPTKYWSLNMKQGHSSNPSSSKAFRLESAEDGTNEGIFEAKGGIAISGFSESSFSKGFYLEIIFSNTASVSTDRNLVNEAEILLSSCQPQQPSIQVELSNNNVKATVKTMANKVTTLSVPYEEKQKNRLILNVRRDARIISIQLSNEPEIRVEGKVYTNTVDSDLGDKIHYSAVPLMVGGCRPRDNNIEKGFVGKLYKVEIAECDMTPPPLVPEAGGVP